MERLLKKRTGCTKRIRMCVSLLLVVILCSGLLQIPARAASTASEIKAQLDIILNRSPLKDATYTSFNNMGRGSGCYAYVYTVSLELFGVGIPAQEKNSYGYATKLKANSNWKQVGSTAASTTEMISLLKTSQSGDIIQFGNPEVNNHIALIYETTSTSITLYDTTSSKGLRIRTYNWNNASPICSFNGVGGGLSLYRCTKDVIVNSSYTVSFDANGGSGAPAAQTKTQNTALTLSSTKPSRSGYHFLGWAESSTASTPVYQPGGSYTKDESKTLYAVWGKTFEITGGKGTYTLGKPVTISYYAGGASSYDIVINLLGEGEVFRVENTTATSVTYTPTKVGKYNISAFVHLINGSTYQQITIGGTHFSVVEPPTNLVASTDKGSYQLEETVTFTLSADNATKYQISIWDGGEFRVGKCVYLSDFSETGIFTFTPTAAGTYGIGYQAENDAGTYITAHGTFTVAAPLSIATQPQNTSIAEGGSAAFSVTASGSGLTYQWQVSTNGGSSWSNSPADGNKTATLTVPATMSRNGYKYRCVVKSSSGGSATSSAATLTVTAAVKITAQPKSVSIAEGGSATFSVAASGSGLTYQWQVSTNGGSSWSNSPADGNKTATLTVPATTSRNGYKYRCVVKSGSSSVTSAAATLTVTAAVKITAQPESVSIAEGGSATFSVTASGSGLTYQWQVCEAGKTAWKNSPAAGNKTATLTVPATASRSGYKYRCVVKSGSSSVTSSAATLTVTGAAPKITVQPKSMTASAGTYVQFSVTASGSGLTYQWQVCEAGKTTWKNSPAEGNQTATLTVPVTAARNGYKYRCIVKSGSSSVTSDAATLTVS